MLKTKGWDPPGKPPKSKRQQWYHHRIWPWLHLVPIDADLSNLDCQLDWFMNQRQGCAVIATNGAFAADQVVEGIEDDLLEEGVR